MVGWDGEGVVWVLGGGWRGYILQLEEEGIGVVWWDGEGAVWVLGGGGRGYVLQLEEEGIGVV